MNAFETYLKYIALKQHFTSDYDYFKYRGKTNANRAAFEKRKDRYSFDKLSKRHKDIEGFIAYNLFLDESTYVRDLLEDKAEKHYAEWRRRIESLGYTFKNDLSKLSGSLDDNLACVDGGYPRLFVEYKRQHISPETPIIFNKVLGVFPVWRKQVEDKVLFPDSLNKLEKLQPFLNIDTMKYKKIMQDRFLSRE